MKEQSMTALVSAFSRGYHARHNEIKIFDDELAARMLTEEEEQGIAFHMCKHIHFFHPAFRGTESQALRWIMDHQLSPSPLGRAAWAEKALHAAVKTGTVQYLIVAAGYDTFAYRQPAWATDLEIFELDHPVMCIDKQARVQRIVDCRPSNLTYVPIELTIESFSETMRSCAAFDQSKLSFCSLLGITYYLPKQSFLKLIESIANGVPNGSAIAFDYPDEFAYTEQAGPRAKRQAIMTRGTTEAMHASYSYGELETLLADRGFLIYEHLTPDEITKQYFAGYNQANPHHPIAAFDNVNYCLAVKR